MFLRVRNRSWLCWLFVHWLEPSAHCMLKIAYKVVKQVRKRRSMVFVTVLWNSAPPSFTGHGHYSPNRICHICERPVYMNNYLLNVVCFSQPVWQVRVNVTYVLPSTSDDHTLNLLVQQKAIILPTNTLARYITDAPVKHAYDAPVGHAYDAPVGNAYDAPAGHDAACGWAGERSRSPRQQAPSLVA